MNRVTYDIFRFTPSELRSKRRDVDRLVADGRLKLRLPYTGDLRFADALAHRRPRAVPGVESVNAAVYRRTITSCGNPGVVEISDARDGKHLNLVVHLPSLQSLIDDVARCRRIFGLDRPSAGQTPLARDPLLRPLVRKRRGLRVPGAWDPYETSLRILLGQQVSVAGASTLTGRLVAAFGAPIPGLAPMSLTHVFPPAAVIAGSSIDRIKSIGLPAARASAIREFARAYADERLQLDGGTALEELLESLRSLPGVGAWTSQMIAKQAAGHAGAFPAGDLGLRRAAGALTGEARPLTESALETLAERWRPHRALAAMHLWMSGV
jgi:AraC family transcriptional regulator of adaptative response / DNA-3-methyladenine glycosylase II